MIGIRVLFCMSNEKFLNTLYHVVSDLLGDHDCCGVGVGTNAIGHY